MANLKRYIVTLLGEDGRVLRCIARKAKEGYTTYVQQIQVTKVGRKNVKTSVARGVNAKVADYAAAVAAVDANAAAAVTAGWARKVSQPRVGFAAKAEDAFTLATLPSPKKVQAPTPEAPTTPTTPEASAPPADAPEPPAATEPPAAEAPKAPETPKTRKGK